MKSIIVALILLFSSTATTTTGFQLALTRSKIINFTRRTTKTPPTAVTVAPSKTSSSSSISIIGSGSGGGGICKKLFRRRNLLLNSSTPTPAATSNYAPTVQVQTPTSTSVSTHDRKEEEEDYTTQQVNNNNKKIDNKRIIALVTTSCLLLSIIHRPNVACAATTTTMIPHSPLSSSLSSLLLSSPISLIIDPATLTTTTDGLTILNINNNNNNLLSRLIATTLATIQMKQQSMIMFALAFGLTIVLLRCAEGGYVKLVEFVANSCLGYYGMNCHEDCGTYSHSRSESGVVKKKKKKSVDWNEYVLRLPRRKEGVATVKNKDDERGNFVLDGKTMLFQPIPNKAARGRGDDIMMERANQSYREKQHEQHQHQDTDKSLPTAATAASSSSSTNLDTPSPHSSSWDNYKTTLHKHTQTQAEHDETSEKLQILKNLVTWEDYKHLVSELQRKKEECSRLQEEVDSLTRRLLLEVEERTVQNQKQQYRSTTTPEDGVADSGVGVDHKKELELKTLADKAKEYDETMQESKMKNGDSSVRWH